MGFMNNYTTEEWINGRSLMSPRPRLNHMNTLDELTAQFKEYFKGSSCKARQEYALFLTKENTDEILSNSLKLKKLISSKKAEIVPDLMVYCNLKQEFYRGIIGVPNIIVEVLSPSNCDDDTVDKFLLYAEYGVLEYWIVSPMSRTVKIYRLNENNEYKLFSEKGYDDVSISSIYSELKVCLSNVNLVEEPNW